MTTSIKCPKCSSEQINGGSQGFGAKKAIAGAVVAGPVGLVAGAINKNKLTNSCMACGHRWDPADNLRTQQRVGNLGKPGHTLGYSNSDWVLSGVIGVIFCVAIIVWL